MKKIFFDKRFISFLQYILVVLIILECNSIYSQIYGCHYLIRGSMISLSILILFFLLIAQNYQNKIKFNKYSLLIIFYLFFSSVCMILNSSGLSSILICILNFMLFFPLLFIYLFSISKKNLKNLICKFVNVIFVISLISLFFYVFGLLLNIIPPLNTIKVVWGKPYTVMYNYYYLFFDSYQYTYWLTGYPVPRNMGIFGEAPMFAFVILLALVFNNLLFYKNKSKTKEFFIINLVLIVTMISTISVTGVCSMFLVLFHSIFNLFKKLSNKLKIKVLILLIIFTIIIIPVGINILDKKFDSSSASHRSMDIVNGFKIFLDEPLLGYGINHKREFENNPNIGYGYSNIIIPILTDGGLVLSIIYILPLIFIIAISFVKKKLSYFIISFIYIIILFTTAVQYRLFLLFFISLLYLIVIRSFENDLL